MGQLKCAHHVLPGIQTSCDQAEDICSVKFVLLREHSASPVHHELELCVQPACARP
jgi:hypothetical protein